VELVHYLPMCYLKLDTKTDCSREISMCNTKRKKDETRKKKERERQITSGQMTMLILFDTLLYMHCFLGFASPCIIILSN